MMDDMIEGAEYRSNRNTWHILKGPQSTCDIYLLQSCIYKLLGKYFLHHRNFNRMMEIFIGSGFKAAVGETFQHELKGLESFTMENFETIATFKTAIPGFVAPFQLACLLFHRVDCVEDESCINLMKESGLFSQIQNDYWDCYGETQLGKTGNDIQENVCSVLIAEALQKANTEQKEILSESYGHYEPDKVKKVKKVYEDLQLENLFDQLLERSQKNINSELKRMNNDSKRSLMNNIITKIYTNVLKKTVEK